MSFEWDAYGKTYWLTIGFSGTRIIAWKWRREDQRIPSTMYRCHPVTLTVFDRSLSTLKAG